LKSTNVWIKARTTHIKYWNKLLNVFLHIEFKYEIGFVLSSIVLSTDPEANIFTDSVYQIILDINQCICIYLIFK